MTKERAIFNWSGGKDSALALHYAQNEGKYEIAGLLTTVNETYQRISMHGVRNALLHKQAQSIGIPVQEVLLPESPSMADYDQIMNNVLGELRQTGISHSIFGDIFLEDLREYREARLKEAGLKAVFPLWKRNTTDLIKEFIDLGFKTVVVCVKSPLLSADFAGRIIDHDFLKDLPGNVDPCGENGEFHTFVFDGPIFKEPVAFDIGEVVYRTYKLRKEEEDNCFSQDQQKNEVGFHYCDLIPKGNEAD